MEEHPPTMESVLRTLREMQKPRPDNAPCPQAPTVTEEVERAITE